MSQVGAAEGLKNVIVAHLSRAHAPEQEFRDRAARVLMERAQNLRRPEHFSSRIEMVVAESDQEHGASDEGNRGTAIENHNPLAFSRAWLS